MAPVRWALLEVLVVLVVLAVLACSTGTAGARALAGAPRCPAAPQRCELRGYGQNEYTYTVDGIHLEIEFTDSGYFTLKCTGNLTLDNPALPRFDSQLRVNKALLAHCPPPRASYVAVLRRLNVLVLEKLTLSDTGTVTSAHLADLPQLRALVLERAALSPGALMALGALRGLVLDRVRLPPAELQRLPPSLRALHLLRLHEPVPADALRRLPDLTELLLRDPEPVSLQLAGSLQTLSLETPRAPRALLPSLRTLSLFNWAEPRPEPWQQCDALATLEVRYAAAEELPERWVHACGALRVLRVRAALRLRRVHAATLAGAARLRELSVERCALTSLPAGLLADAAQLMRLSVTACALTSLPEGLLDAAPLLTHLDLSANRLLALPGGLFGVTKSLISLNLSKNNFTTDVFSSLVAVVSLTRLVLSDNINLRDSCGQRSDLVLGTSPLQFLNKLTYLELRNTSTSIICRDWREQMPHLNTLDLSNNSFTFITYADMQFGSNATVKLSGNNVTGVRYTREDYARALRAADARAAVLLDGALRCDCGAYWAARALRERPRHARLRGATCASGAALADAPPEDMLCDAPELCARAPPGCTCAQQPRGGVPALLVRVACEHAGVARLAQALAPARRALAGAAVAWDVRLPHNRVAELAPEDLPAHLEALDLRDNELSVISADTARALLANESRRVWLARNPLACGCGAAPTLRVLRERRHALADYAELTCAGGALLVDAAPGCGALVAALGASAAALVAAAALAALLARPSLRRRLKEALRARGPDPPAARYDVFVSFAHADERWVRAELVARLEARGLRVLVHYRDWAPGGWIPAQIAASVRAARRTVAVLSESFLRSAWARAELREALALALREARPRLLLLLLAAPERLPLDAALRAYLAANTYVRWGDPWFWHKLQLALPRPRAAAPAAPPPEHTPDTASPPPTTSTCQTTLSPTPSTQIILSSQTTPSSQTFFSQTTPSPQTTISSQTTPSPQTTINSQATPSQTAAFSLTTPLQTTTFSETTLSPQEILSFQTTLSPQTTLSSQTTHSPQTTPSPEMTPSPQTIPTPEMTPSPQKIRSPQTTPSPELTPPPQKTRSPQTTPSPEMTPSPQKTRSPQTAPSPEITPSPQKTRSPQTTPSPEMAPSPQKTHSPQTTPSPEITPSPQKTRSPQTTPSPEIIHSPQETRSSQTTPSGRTPLSS